MALDVDDRISCYYLGWPRSIHATLILGRRVYNIRLCYKRIALILYYNFVFLCFYTGCKTS